MEDKVAELKAMIEKEKLERSEQFAKELAELQDKHKVDLIPVIQIVNNQIHTTLQAVARD